MWDRWRKWTTWTLADDTASVYTYNYNAKVVSRLKKRIVLYEVKNWWHQIYLYIYLYFIVTPNSGTHFINANLFTKMIHQTELNDNNKPLPFWDEGDQLNNNSGCSKKSRRKWWTKVGGRKVRRRQYEIDHQVVIWYQAEPV